MTRKRTLSKEQVKAIRAEYMPFVFGMKRLAKKHKIPISTIRDCVTYATYKEVR